MTSPSLLCLLLLYDTRPFHYHMNLCITAPDFAKLLGKGSVDRVYYYQTMPIQCPHTKLIGSDNLFIQNCGRLRHGGDAYIVCEVDLVLYLQRILLPLQSASSATAMPEASEASSRHLLQSACPKPKKTFCSQSLQAVYLLLYMVSHRTRMR